MKLYEEILFLQGYFKGGWIVENVISWYKPLIKPYEIERHYFWSSFVLPEKKFDTLFDLRRDKNSHKESILGFNLSKYKGIDKTKILRNTVNPKVALYLFNCAFKDKQFKLEGDWNGRT
jgi:DNA (cytosine-5)-methyltransferase 1